MGSVARQYSGSTSSRSFSLFPGLPAGVAFGVTQRLAIVEQLRRPFASGRASVLFIAQSGGHAGPPLRRHARRDGTLNAEKRCRGRPTCLPGVHGQVVLQHRPSLSGGSRVVGFKKNGETVLPCVAAAWRVMRHLRTYPIGKTTLKRSNPVRRPHAECLSGDCLRFDLFKVVSSLSGPSRRCRLRRHTAVSNCRTASPSVCIRACIYSFHRAIGRTRRSALTTTCTQGWRLKRGKRCRGRPACLPGVRELAVLQHRPF